VVFADEAARFADWVFGTAANSPVITTDAWIGTFAYSMQIYFDFSAYSGMAIGLSIILGLQLPLNFNSPYTATSIIEFWRHWHMTLSRFLRDYLYVPLGGNRLGDARRTLTIVMLLGGLWHGAVSRSSHGAAATVFI
jgi:alginate O-acetyltransferase complex protein AlgI